MTETKIKYLMLPTRFLLSTEVLRGKGRLVGSNFVKCIKLRSIFIYLGKILLQLKLTIQNGYFHADLVTL